MAAAALRHAFLRADGAAAHQTWRQVADGFRPRRPRLAGLMDGAEHDVPARTGSPARHRRKPRSANPPERVDAETKRRTGVAGTAPDEAAVVRLVGAALPEVNDGRAARHRHVRPGPTGDPVPAIEADAAPPDHAPVPPRAA